LDLDRAAACGEEIRAPEEKELGVATRGKFCSRMWQGWDSGELQQQEVSTVAGRRRLQSREHSKNRAAPKEEEKGDFPRDLFVILENCRDLSVKTILTAVLGLKQKCNQNESCTTFRTLQLCFRG
jgi:hypothetical protein